jgi:hypothetical protein
MKATEIVEKLKSVLLSADAPVQEELSKEVEEVEVKDAVELEDMPEEAPVAEEAKPEYATKDELESALAEMRAMYSQLVEKMGSEEMETEVPAEELSAQEQEVDLSANEPAAEPITHSPEVADNGPALNLKIAPRRQMSTEDRIFAQLTKIRN